MFQTLSLLGRHLAMADQLLQRILIFIAVLASIVQVTGSTGVLHCPLLCCSRHATLACLKLDVPAASCLLSDLHLKLCLRLLMLNAH